VASTVYNGTHNVNYLATITNYGDNGDSVTGPMPDKFSLRIQSDWEASLASYMSNGIIGQINAGLQAFTGASFYTKSLTGQIWRGSQPIGFQLDMQFDAITDTIQDVTAPVYKLMLWASPKRNGVILSAPGPTIAYQNNRISVRIGRFLYFDSVVMPTVDVTWIAHPDAPGQYIGADVSINFITFFTPDRDDIAAYFGQGPTGGTGSANFTAGNDFVTSDANALNTITRGGNNTYGPVR
jgi:hypothetical protein